MSSRSLISCDHTIMAVVTTLPVHNDNPEVLADNRLGWDSVLKTLSAQNASLSSLHTQRLREQNAMLETNHDLHQLHRAVNSFTSLQEIKLLRLQDDADEQLISFVGHRALQNARHLSLSWKAACTRAVTNLSTALLNSQHKYIRFAAPQLSPKASLQLLQTPTETISAIASRLTSLNITFTSDRDITIMMASLSDTFNHFFNSATNLSSIHLGFPSLLPLDLDLDAIFHGTTLKNLHTLSLQSWRLASHEITTLTRRHRHTLCELRLCAVYLRPGGRWRDILSTLREELGSLERLHLRDIDYEGHFEATAIVAGVEVMDIQFAETDPPLQMNTPPSQVQDSGFSSGVVGSGLRCRDARRETLTKVAGFTVDDLCDDGIQVRPEQIPLWESWVLAGRKGRSNGHLC